MLAIRKAKSLFTVVLTIAIAFATCHAFAEDAYIESDGTSGILTDYKLKSTTRIEVDFALTETGHGNARVFGADRSHTALHLSGSLYVHSNGSHWQVHVGDGTAYKNHYVKSGGTLYESDTVRHVAEIDYPNRKLRLYTNGAAINQTDDFDSSLSIVEGSKCAEPVALFARQNAAGDFTDPSKARIYGVKIYESDALVHDFVPCMRDGIAAFRDAVTGDFIYGEQAPLAFTAGGDFKTYESPYVATPADNSTYYIDTGYQATSNTCVKLDCALMGTWENGMSAWYLFYGYGTQPFAGFVNGAGFGAYTKDGDWNTTGVVPSANLRPDVRGTFVVDNYNRKSYALVAGITNGTVKTPAQSLERCPSTTISVKIASHFRGNDNFVPMKIYGCKIYEEGALVRDFRPCAIGPAQDGSSFVGLRDAITGAFATYPAATAANRLSCGGDDFPAAAPYVETLHSSSRYIDTGYSVTDNTKVALDYAPAETKASGDTWYFFGGAGAKRFVALLQDKGFGFSNDSWSHLNLGMTTEGMNTFVRRTIILDNPAAMGVVETAGVTNLSRTVDSAAGKDYGSKTLKLSTLGDANDHFASIRIYGCKIWERENGGYVLKRDYVPAVENNVAGLRDATGSDTTFRVCASTAASPLTYGGVFTPVVAPTAAKVTHGNTVTLTATSPGATSYRWFRNGEEIPGATSSSLDVLWRRGGETDTYAARSVYAVDAATIESGESESVAVENVTPGLILIVR